VPELGEIEAVAAGVSNVPRGGMTNVGVEGLTDAGIRQRGRRGLIGRVGPRSIPLNAELLKVVKSSVIVNGLPEFQTRTLLVCQPPNARFLAPLKFFPFFG
jgi:hypothetical protein